MNKEEKEFILKCLENDMLDNNQIELLLNYIKKLEKENEMLKDLLKQAQEDVKIWRKIAQNK